MRSTFAQVQRNREAFDLSPDAVFGCMASSSPISVDHALSEMLNQFSKGLGNFPVPSIPWASCQAWPGHRPTGGCAIWPSGETIATITNLSKTAPGP